MLSQLKRYYSEMLVPLVIGNFQMLSESLDMAKQFS